MPAGAETLEHCSLQNSLPAGAWHGQEGWAHFLAMADSIIQAMDRTGFNRAVGTPDRRIGYVFAERFAMGISRIPTKGRAAE
ncbi:MAG: hypothetical protein C4293_22160 [Nitrospiraceae bacterium]